MKFLNKLLIKLYIKAHNFLYHKISRLSTKLNHNLHPKHEIMKYYQFFIDNVSINSDILDIGCGIGYVSHKVAEYARNVVGIDINKNSIKYAKKHYNRDNIKYVVGDALNYKFDKKFNIIILSNVLEHIERRIEFLEKIKYLTNFILIRVPLINRSWLPIYKKSIGLEYRLDNTHFIEYTLESFQNEIQAAGLKILNYQIKFGEIWAKIGAIV